MSLYNCTIFAYCCYRIQCKLLASTLWEKQFILLTLWDFSLLSFPTFQIRLVCAFFLTVLISHLLIGRWHYWSGVPSQLNLEVLKENLSSEYAVKTQCQASARQLGKNSMNLSQITDCENCK